MKPKVQSKYWWVHANIKNDKWMEDSIKYPMKKNSK